MAKNKSRKAAAAPPKPKNWFQRRSKAQQSALIVGGTFAAVGGHFLLWGAVIPAVGKVVGRIPVVSTVVGWLFAGAAFAAIGVLLINEKAPEDTRKRLKWVAGVWGAVALLCIPSGFANGVVLPTDYWAGVYAGAYGVVMVPLVFIAGALLLTLGAKVLKREKGPTETGFGWVLVAYSFLLLIWGSSLLRL
ncbi:hypothetical protein [Saccharothrix variisporea]|uniref:Uncharacterized protein n=1 Tax=Saccharothrix variisporea TaxID=543527 RepID=A0A495XNK5_9PSEU|nr:hypothetical protein [Saccharothrix variisporea]RKT73238.1 hypothetical protein DFJ66_6567 [Saccharothrix variisporea]